MKTTKETEALLEKIADAGVTEATCYLGAHTITDDAALESALILGLVKIRIGRVWLTREGWDRVRILTVEASRRRTASLGPAWYRSAR